jgi:hypothetical protein
MNKFYFLNLKSYFNFKYRVFKKKKKFLKKNLIHFIYKNTKEKKGIKMKCLFPKR